MVTPPDADKYARRMTVDNVIHLATGSHNAWQLVGVAEGEISTEMLFDLNYGFRSWDKDSKEEQIVRRVRIRITTEE